MLINCVECGLSVSDKAVTCPHCGYPISQKVKPKYKQDKKYRKLPNGFGTIKFIKKKLRKPYVAYPSVKGYKDNGSPIIPKPIGYFETWQDAFEALSAYNKHPYNTDMRSVTFSDVYNWFYKEKFSDPKRKYSKSTIISIESAYTHLKHLAEVPFNSINAMDLQNILDNLDMRHAGQEMVLNLIRQMYKYAVKHEITDRNCAEFLTIKIADDDIKGIPFTVDEINMMWEHSDNKNVQLVLMMIYTGFRVTEFATAKLDEEKMIFVGGVKTRAGKNRTVPVNDNIKCFLDTWKKTKATTGSAMTRHFRSAMEDLGLTYATKDIKHTPHDCRHTFSWLCDKYKVDDFSKHLLLGHSLGNDVERVVYGHRTVEELTEEINKIPRIIVH